MDAQSLLMEMLRMVALVLDLLQQVQHYESEMMIRQQVALEQQ